MEQAREWIQSAMLSVTYSPCWRGNPPDDSFVSPALFLLLANKVDLLGSKDDMSQTTVDAEKALRLAESYGADFAGRIFFWQKIPWIGISLWTKKKQHSPVVICVEMDSPNSKILWKPIFRSQCGNWLERGRNPAKIGQLSLCEIEDGPATIQPTSTAIYNQPAKKWQQIQENENLLPPLKEPYLMMCFCVLRM